MTSRWRRCLTRSRRALVSKVRVGPALVGAVLAACVTGPAPALGSRSLYSRLHTRLRIDPLVPDDTAEYIRHRLRLAGCDREIVTSDAIAMLHEATLGALRDLDRLATAALRLAARRKKKLVERDLVAHVIDADSRAND